ncbi:hypothetical protein YTPLAS18_03060 [Nitrospira sp.]|nr:hypothetical protein YTPLAS18_03060 [Nitrospira sp.]
MQRSRSLNLLLLSVDSDLHDQVKHTFKGASLTIAKHTASISKLLQKKEFDAVLIESKRRSLAELSLLKTAANSSRTIFITGSRRSLRQAITLLRDMTDGELIPKGNGADPSLEELIQSKVSDFVKGMRNGSARNLYPMLISAVERPLLSLTLRETHGNQIQAARLLGMNRNTLRKKIAELHIPLSRTKSAHKIAL